MKYIKLFNNHSDYETYISGNPDLPNVSYSKDTEKVDYNPFVDYSKEYLTLEAKTAGTITIIASNANVAKTISYSTDDGTTWTSLTTSTTEQSFGNFAIGDKLLLKGTNSAYATDGEDNFIRGTAQVDVYGNIMSLVGGDNFKTLTTLTDNYALKGIFAGNTNLLSAENLILSATTLTKSCYSYLFQNCTSLTTAPELPATTLAQYCYSNMFKGCTSLTTAPELPATTLAGGCYHAMFSGCTGLTSAPSVLPATTLSGGCYQYMFNGCTSLTSAPQMSFTSFASSSQENTCRSMFQGCTSLTTAPSVLAPTTLTKYCYFSMFEGCTSLTTAPELPADTLVVWCYYQMFKDCSSLNYIKAMFTSPAPGASYNFTSNWVSGVASTGTFVKNSAATWEATGVYGVPSGWTVETASS